MLYHDALVFLLPSLPSNVIGTFNVMNSRSALSREGPDGQHSSHQPFIFLDESNPGDFGAGWEAPQWMIMGGTSVCSSEF